MTTSAGYFGHVEWATSNANFAQNVYNWTLSYEAGEGETTDFTTAGPKTWIPLTTEWSGSFICRLDDTTAIPSIGVATDLELHIYYDVGVTEFGYKGSAFVTSAAPTQDVNGTPEVTISFRGSGALTIGSIL